MLLLVTLGMNCPAQSKADLVGTWKLVSAWSTQPNGTRVSTYGENPTGFLTYTPEGRMIVIVGRSDRKPLSGNRVTSSAAERAEAFSTILAYAGPYSVEQGKVIHHIEACTYPNWIGSHQVRTMKLEGDRLTLVSQTALDGGTAELRWQRMK
jgi:hypothetical protein